MIKIVTFFFLVIASFNQLFGQINCFVYHRVGEAKYASTNISTEVFEQQLAWLKQNQYEVITLSEAIKLVKSGEVEGKKVVITVDDAYTSFFNNGLPLLKKYGYPATLFVNTENIGQKGYMSWSELAKLSQQGVEIGNHTHTHQYFLDLPEAERANVFKSDVITAQNLLKEKLGISPKIFAYPFGEYSQSMKLVIKGLDFEAAAAQNSGVFSPNSEMLAIPRFPMGGGYATLNGFKEKLRMKPLKVEVPSPFDQLSSENPPTLTLKIIEEDLIWSSLNCYIGGKKQGMIIRDGNVVSLKAPYTLKSRRTLYTLTAQDKDGNWHWFSHVWVNPKVKE